jgi:hypothetical protein
MFVCVGHTRFAGPGCPASAIQGKAARMFVSFSRQMSHLPFSAWLMIWSHGFALSKFHRSNSGPRTSLPSSAISFETRFAESAAKTSRWIPSSASTIEPADPQSLLDELNLNQETVQLIRPAYAICNGQVVLMAQYLKDHDHVHISRNRLAEILDIMKLPRIKRIGEWPVRRGTQNSHFLWA